MSEIASSGDKAGEPELSDEERASIAAFSHLSFTERFDQLVRTVRFINLGRSAVERAQRG